MDFLKRAFGVVGFVIGFAVVYGAIHLMQGGDKLKNFETYSSKEGQFSVLFPGKPKKEIRNVDTPIGKIEFVMFGAGSKKGLFAVAYTDYPKEVINNSEPTKMLDGARDGAVKNVNGQLISENTFEFNGYPAREIKIEIAKKGTVRARLILKDKRLYQLLVTGASSDIIDEKGSKFFDSFSIEDM